MISQEARVEKLLVRLLHHLFERMPTQIVLKGGFVLRLLECERRTNDIDIVLIPFVSKRAAAPLLEEALASFPCERTAVHIHPTAIRMLIHDDGVVAQVEASIAENCPSIPMSTANLATLHHELPRIVRVMRFDVALSNKIGAWLERGLYRDLYDIFYWVGVQKATPHWPTLMGRLAKLKPRKGLPRTCTLDQLALRLELAATDLRLEPIQLELQSTLSESELSGLVPRMRGTLSGFAQKLPHLAPTDYNR
jgi:predicted nucleotidyltransferase component of viral defense system